jgi:acetolactate decarboxylase
MRVVTLSVFLFTSLLAFAQNPVIVEGAMKNVMWKGQLDAVVNTDTLPKGGLYAMGPMAYLEGEVLVWNDTLFISQVGPKGEMTVRQAPSAGMPFIAHSNIGQWVQLEIPNDVKDMAGLERFLDSLAQPTDAPYFFKIEGHAESASVHIVNLPAGSQVTSPAEAHKGLQQYLLEDCTFRALGFYSQNHQTIFTHHDTHLHMHLMTGDNQQMGHLENLVFGKTIKLYLAK